MQAVKKLYPLPRSVTDYRGGRCCLSFIIQVAIALGGSAIAHSLPAPALESREIAKRSPRLLAQVTPPSTDPLPEPQFPPIPPPGELLPPSSPETTPQPPVEVPDTIVVEQFEVVGSTVFSAEELEKITAPFEGRSLSLSQLYLVRSKITKLYTERGYATSFAFIPPQTLQAGTVTIQVVEGGLDEIQISGNGRLEEEYIRRRIEAATQTPLNINELLEALQLLQLDPLIDNIAAELSAGSRSDCTSLAIQIQRSNAFEARLLADNGRSPAVGSFRRQIQLTHSNLLGLGDGLGIAYSNTEGSDTFDATYIVPLTANNGTLQLAYGTSDGEIIEEPFTVLDIQVDSEFFELGFRQPIIRTPNRELALSLSLSRQESQSVLPVEDITGEEVLIPLSPGADEEGRTEISAVRFSQEWIARGERQVLAVRSQFSLGVAPFDETVNRDEPDSRFFAWRLQGQWLRQLAPDTLLLLRSDLQLSDRALVPLEQFTLGGIDNVRGYRQNLLLTDNGIFASAEVRLPLARLGRDENILQVVPFVDFGTGWNSSEDNANRLEPDPDTLVALGVGLRLGLGDRFNARLDWGIPLIDVDPSGDSLQEEGIYLSIVGSFF